MLINWYTVSSPYALLSKLALWWPDCSFLLLQLQTPQAEPTGTHFSRKKALSSFYPWLFLKGGRDGRWESSFVVFFSPHLPPRRTSGRLFPEVFSRLLSLWRQCREAQSYYTSVQWFKGKRGKLTQTQTNKKVNKSWCWGHDECKMDEMLLFKHLLLPLRKIRIFDGIFSPSSSQN